MGIAVVVTAVSLIATIYGIGRMTEESHDFVSSKQQQGDMNIVGFVHGGAGIDHVRLCGFAWKTTRRRKQGMISRLMCAVWYVRDVNEGRAFECCKEESK